MFDRAVARNWKDFLRMEVRSAGRKTCDREVSGAAEDYVNDEDEKKNQC